MIWILGTFAFCFGIWVVIRGFEGAGDALDNVLDGRKKDWLWVGFYGLFVVLGAGLSSGVITYWLTFYTPG